MRDFRKLTVWNAAHGLVLEIYGVCAKFPRDERFILAAQLQRAAISIPSNIAEGVGRFSDAEFRRHVEFATGSSKEVEYQILLAKDLGYVSERDYANLVEKLDRVQRLLRGLHKALAKSSRATFRAIATESEQLIPEGQKPKAKSEKP